MRCPDPKPTREARARHVRDFVVLQAVITEFGTVGQIQVMKGLDYGLTERAIETVRSWRISPAIGSDGKPMAMRIAILVTFGLENRNKGGGIATG
jgi:TonB family protein